MIIYERNTDAPKNGASVVSKVHAQVCKVGSIPANSEVAKGLSVFLENEFKKGVSDHKTLVDLALKKIDADKTK